MDSTLDKFAHFDKGNMSKQNQILNKHTQKLIVPPYKHQEVSWLPLLILKRGL
jgi:hypothetical protein